MRARGRPRTSIHLEDGDREQLLAWTRQRMTAQVLALRANIVLASAAGQSDVEVADRLSISHQTVAKWRKRFLEKGMSGLGDTPRPGAPPKVDDETLRRLIMRTITEKPVAGTHWTTRKLAAEFGLSQTTISRIWRDHGLRPWQQETFQLSTEPGFRERIVDLVGLHLDFPVKAFALCIGPGRQDTKKRKTVARRRPARQITHKNLSEHLRQGEASIRRISRLADTRTASRHSGTRALLGFFHRIADSVPETLETHLVIDDAQQRPSMLRWLIRRPWIRVHFTPHSAAWFHELVECYLWLGKLHENKGIPPLTQAMIEVLGNLPPETGSHNPTLTWVKKISEIEWATALIKSI